MVQLIYYVLNACKILNVKQDMFYLEQVYKEGVNQMNKDQGSFENMNKRAINAERARDDANLLVECLQHKVKREEMK